MTGRRREKRRVTGRKKRKDGGKETERHRERETDRQAETDQTDRDRNRDRKKARNREAETDRGAGLRTLWQCSHRADEEAQDLSSMGDVCSSPVALETREDMLLSDSGHWLGPSAGVWSGCSPSIDKRRGDREKPRKALYGWKTQDW